jgi:hypothetical protein
VVDGRASKAARQQLLSVMALSLLSFLCSLVVGVLYIVGEVKQQFGDPLGEVSLQACLEGMAIFGRQTNAAPEL